MYKVEWEKIDGTSGWVNPGVYARDQLDQAELLCERLWARHCGGEYYAVFRVIDVSTDTIYSELECA